MKLWSILLVSALLCFSAQAHAADGAKMALVINQVDYQSLTPLPDTDGEAAQMKNALVKVGFDVTSIRDATLDGSGGHPNLRQVIKDFRRKLAASPGAIGFIYYTGHGMADPTDEKGDNYLLSIDADVQVAADLPSSGIKLGDLMDGMANTNAQAVIIVVDACRNTPSLGKGATKGLVAVAADPNTLVAYSTDLGDIAGVGVYAPILAAELVKPGKTVTQVFDSVQVQVANQTGRKQRPWSNNRIYDTICLAGCTININTTNITAGPSVEQTFWASAKDCGDYRAYLNKYPNGDFAALAQTRLGDPLCNISRNPTSFDAGLTPAINAGVVGLCDIKAGSEFDQDRAATAPYIHLASISSPDAVEACQKAVDQDPNNRHLQLNLGRAYLAGNVLDKAGAWFAKSAAAGNSEAMVGMGLVTARLNVDPAGYAAARDWFQKASDMGNGDASALLAEMYLTPNTGFTDATKARPLALKAAAAGQTTAMTDLAAMYFHGIGGAQDYGQALVWYRTAGEKGDVTAMVSTGFMYENGYGTTQDYGTARHWYEQAMAAGDVSATASLGTLYYNGHGVTQDLVVARRLFLAAAQAGNNGAMANIGLMFQNGLGGPLDLAQARTWYQQAAAGGNIWAAEQLKTLSAN